jgi:signal transduction histidine kinase
MSAASQAQLPSRIQRSRFSLARLSLSQRFALTGSAVMLAAAVIIGAWVNGIIQRNVVTNTASATALFMDSFIAPLVQELETADTLSVGPVRAIEEVLGEDTALGRRVVSVKIWKPGGLVAYAEDASLIGKRFPDSDELEEAFKGNVVSELDELEDEESEAERSSGLSLLEIYSPIRRAWTGEVIAVVEFYEDAAELHAALSRARLQTAGITAAITLMIGGALFGIVHRASGTIEEQRGALRARMEEAERMAEQNRTLRLRVERASARVTELNERFLRRVSADLHDGPAQLISLAALRLTSIVKGETREARQAEMAAVKAALDEAMGDIRNVCGGLSLPEIASTPLPETIVRAVTAHERHSGTTVELTLSAALPEEASEALKICVFRFVQEGLNNAFRHGGGSGQQVEASADAGALSVTVRNAFDAERSVRKGGGLGLSGLRERVESLGGRFEFIMPSAEEGGEVVMNMLIGAGAGHG